MNFLLDFLRTEEVEKAKIFPQLKCSAEEAILLRHMVKEYLEGSADMNVFDVVSTMAPGEGYEHVAKVQGVKTLIDLGWIVLGSYHHIKTSEITSLELLHSSVSLSAPFLKLLEEGNLETMIPEAKPYEDHLEYLQDQFFRIDLYQKLATIRHSFDQTSPNYKRVKSKLSMLENKIGESLAATEETPQVERFFKDNSLNEKEQVIFLALLKEEYSGGDDNLREMNTLIDLISFDDYEKIKNRELLEEKSNLIEKGIIDYDEMLTPFGGIARSFYITEDVLSDIIHPKKKKKEKMKLDVLIKEQEIFELIEPKTTLDDVVLHPKTRETIDTLLRQMDKDVTSRLKAWGIRNGRAPIDAKVIFHGEPGTGKTMTAYSLAKALKKQVIGFDCSKILSMYVGESEKNVRQIFDGYKEIVEKTKAHPILLLNEADQFLSARSTSPGSSADKMHNQMQNIFLEQIERFEGVLVATTNLLETLDPAFSRRFNYKVRFEKPNEEQRKLLWEKMLPKEAPMADDVDPAKLAAFNLTGGQIDLVIKNTAYKVAAKEEPLFTYADFADAIKKELSGTFGDEKTAGFLA